MSKEPAKSCARAMEVVNKRYGKKTIRRGDQRMLHVPRLPAGVFMVTYCTGGGYPVWVMTRIKGPESGGKSGLAINAMKMASMICWKCFNVVEFCTCSKSPLRMKTLYADTEGALDRSWVESIGVPPDSYYVPSAADGQELLDIVNMFLGADDCGLAIVDSIANLLPPAETDRSIGDRQVGSLPKLVTDAVAKLQNRLAIEEKRGHPCTVILINQLRYDLKVKFGNPEIEAGGSALRHAYIFGLRVQKASTDDTFKDEERKMKLVQKHSFSVDKIKKWAIAGQGEFIRSTDHIWNKSGKRKSLLYSRGSIIDYKIVVNYARRHGILQKGKNGYTIPGLLEDPLSTLDDMVEVLKANEAHYYQLHKIITDAAREQAWGKEKDANADMPSLPEADSSNSEADEDASEE